MRKIAYLAPLVLLAAAAGYVLQKYDLRGLDQLELRPREAIADEGDEPGAVIGTGRPTTLPEAKPGRSIRIASFNIEAFGESKLSKPEVVALLARAVREFDIVAIQEIRAKQQDLLPRFLEAVNEGGRSYDFVLGPRLGRTVSKEQYAYLFNQATIELDRASVYTLSDPDDVLHREPLVAAFRARGPAPERAFTFTLVNWHIDPDEVVQELALVDAVHRAVLRDGREEDDVILLGDFNADEERFDEFSSLRRLARVVAGQPTNTRRTAQYDNLLFDARATVESLGTGGVFDLRQAYELTEEQALDLSDHFPIWAEFSLVEGGEAGRLAEEPSPARSR